MNVHAPSSPRTEVSSWPVEMLEKVPLCPVCGSTARAALHSGLRDYFFRVAPGRWEMFRCTDCGSGFLDPRPTRESIGAAYEEYYTHVVRPVSRGARVKGALLSAAYGYLNSRYGLTLTTASPVGGYLMYLVPPIRGFLDGKLRHLPPAEEGSRLLDVGCGHGDFLNLARQAGWRVIGVDVDLRAVTAARARGVEVLHGGLEAIHAGESGYDYITMSHVIEHMHDPLEALRQVFHLLKPGGSTWIETPNIDALGHRRFGRYWRGLEAPRHLVLFSLRALERSLSDAGFIDLRVKYRGTVVPLMHAEGEAASRGLPLGSVAPWRQRVWPCVVDALLEEFLPGRREFITVTARKPE